MAGTGLRAGAGRRRIVLFAGTRPEAIKQAPIALAAARSRHVEAVLVHSGQHGALFDDGLAPFRLRADHRLDVEPLNSRPGDLVTRIRDAVTPLLATLAPDMMVVQGDTSSALAGAQAAAALRIPIAHVEAGLRSGDLASPWPEEGNRVAIARLAALHLAPSEGAARNLAAEAAPGHIRVVGNTAIDALLHFRGATPPRRSDGACRRLLVTAHRREIVGAPLDRVAAALKRLVAGRADRHITVLRHPNPAGDQLAAALAGVAGITVSPGMPYGEMVATLAAADLVLSDSGGLQEECPALGVPLLILRDKTERPEVVAAGAALLVGTNTAMIVATAERLLDDRGARAAMATIRFPYGTGDAAPRIIAAIANYPFPARDNDAHFR